MANRDPERTEKMRIAVRYLLERDCLAKGNQSRLAEHFHVSRQRVHQIVVEERKRLGWAASAASQTLGEAGFALQTAQSSAPVFAMRHGEHGA
jgi:hypothetical protein